ncbi:hypothetical protein Taro_026652 [Colocasia esculenta]|uniref:Uncharacterized protein n=1 Tax=Colocasia esculenta TaxID=4460 RepID=A0A843VL89_COLES|nr:hypothetical protein [Colocasia esculenta]
MGWEVRRCGCLLLCLLLSVLAVSAKTHGNVANVLVNIINENRTAHKLPRLYNSSGLGCIALQYITGCMGNCSSNNTASCEPPEDDITEIFAPNCGVELPTVGIISGRLVGCQWKYLEPAEAFSNVLALNKKSLSILRDKKHTEVGVGVLGRHHGPFFWCILFSSGQTNFSFAIESGMGIKQKKGCFSGPDIPCSNILVEHKVNDDGFVYENFTKEV